MLRAADAAEMFISEGIERVMNTFNAATDKQQEDSGESGRTPCHYGGLASESVWR